MVKRDLYLENMQWLDQRLREGTIGQAEYELQKARLLAGATRSPASKVWGTIGIVLAVLLVMIVLGQVFDSA